MTTLAYISLFAMLASLCAIAAAGIILALPERLTHRLVPHLVSYAIGTLLGAALLGMIPHALEHLAAGSVMTTVLASLIGFFVLESVVLWRHCHERDCRVHETTAILILVGDAFHNFVDGLVIAAAFLASVPVGVAASLAVIAHEIPQEAGDFGILLHAGYSRRKALTLNLLSASTTLAGALGGYVGIQTLRSVAPHVLCVSAASFLYIALADLIPGRRGQRGARGLVVELILIAAGVGTILALQGHHP
ncbi:MAG: ZIP family metal transporter [Verrucomicrobiota bacterium]|nr:ZIP family metal transporter [Verrucomicrobiota bacterium]